MARKSNRSTSKTESSEDAEFNYEADLRIDPDFLDAEFLNHPALFMKYAEQSAKANKLAKEAEERVKTLRSELVKNANEDPDTYLGKGVKPTAPVVEAFYRTDEDYQEAKQEMIDAQYDADMLTNIVFAFQARKLTLENLVRLQGQNYFSSPQEPRDLPDAVERLEEIKKKSVQTKVKQRMNR